MEAFLDGEWESICKLFPVQESTDPSTNFLEYYSPPTSCSNESFPAVNDEISCSSLSGWISNPTHDFLETITQTDSSYDNNIGVDTFLPDVLSCIDFSNIGENDGSYPHDTLKDSPAFKRKRTEETNSIEAPKKNARTSRVALKGKKKAHSKIDEITLNENPKENNAALDTNSDGSDVCDASEEIIETEDSNSNTTVTLTSTGKKRASRGAATDLQSLYARKRRMRINERLKILQSIVPNGTKVDISTMLEEAFHYVKFLQHQIRMLSSDDLWMFAPLAYNGLDIEAYRRMPPFLGL